MTELSTRLRRTIKRLNRRQKHVRKTVFGSADKPRLVVYRSNQHIYAQIVDDISHRTITGCSTLTPAVKERLKDVKNRFDQSKAVGEFIASLAKEHGITTVCFDRNGRRYHGRIKALAEGARSGGLIF